MKRSTLLLAALIAALAGWRASPEFTPRDKAALLLAEAVTQVNVTDEVYAEVWKHLGHQDFVELALTAAFYAMVGRMLDAMRIQLEPDAREDSPRLP